MMRSCTKRVAEELPGYLATQTRSFIAPLRTEFSDEVTFKTRIKDAPSTIDEWRAKKDHTEHVMGMLDTYKTLGDSKNEPLLQNHNPRTFEDLTAAIPNFRTLTLKAGDVPKFFDNVLQKRADEAISAKNAWWAARKQEAEAAPKGAKEFPKMPVPSWALGKPVSLATLNATTDVLFKSSEPKRKLRLPTMPAQVSDAITQYASSLKLGDNVKSLQESILRTFAEHAVVEENGTVLQDFTVVSQAITAKALATRRAEVHDRFVKMVAKRILVSPELALIPMNEVDAQLASKFEHVAPKYQELMATAIAGGSAAAREKNSPEFKTFLLRRDADKVAEDLPLSDIEIEASAKVDQLADPKAALEALLGPLVKPIGSGDALLSEQTKAHIEHKYTPDRYQYKEGMKLVKKLVEQEAALRAELAPAYGADVDIKSFQLHPRTPVQVLFDRMREVTARTSEFEELKAKYSDNPYMLHVINKKAEFLADPSNVPFEEVLYPALTEEMLSIEMAELAETEAMVDELEEEELWLLTLQAQYRHIAKHFNVDLPHSVLGHMDPIFFKKVDFETTHTMDHIDMLLAGYGNDYAKDAWGLENLSHHFLPLIRYRRNKHRKLYGKYDAELCNPMLKQ